MNISRILLITLISSLYSVMSIAETYDVSIEPANVYSKAEFRMWTPEGVDKFRGILMLNPGSNGNGRPQVEDEYWQAFAQKHNFCPFWNISSRSYACQHDDRTLYQGRRRQRQSHT